ncbi:hypothetical protein PAM7971_00302 [Pacificibacter marinus]|uniref:Uncharacterized protein n=1 Tax=Pacificibacter marinus TaxID=658057 RepID=A0A1Y5RIQ6_9RHOB|nr:hypothetical protein PAM7971_00302 [Pacificibacter marinus]
MSFQECEGVNSKIHVSKPAGGKARDPSYSFAYERLND